VDDHAENLLALESVLSDLGQNLVRAQSGREALKRVLVQDFAVILMDVQMPEMNGFETAMLIRERERSQHTPILFLTAYNKSDVHVSTGYSVGAVDYVFKPFQPEILRAKVSAFVELSRKTRELEEEIQRRKSAEEEVLRLNKELEQRVRQRTAELEATNRKLKKEITERKQAESEIIRHQKSIEALNQRLRRAMTETHHRVKNNLQIIAAMVDMHLLDDPQFISADELKTLGIHVQTLAAIHELLTQEAKEDGQAHYIPARRVLEKLIEMLERTIGARRILYDIAEARLSARQGTSLALVVNELISNALKYSAGDINVRLTVDQKTATLFVYDEGPGFPIGFDPIQAANTGLDLVCNLSQWDLGGDVKFSNRASGGGCVAVTIPLAE
jgi:two-component sensor histidine kinase/AmiR/NasT family two-component response regulator